MPKEKDHTTKTFSFFFFKGEEVKFKCSAESENADSTHNISSPRGREERGEERATHLHTQSH